MTVLGYIAVVLLILLVVGGAVRLSKDKGASQDTPPPAQAPVDPDLAEARRGGIVLLRDNDWSHCVFDGLEADWNAKTRQGVRGFAQVPSGRHQARTRGRDGEEVVHDFVLYPGETYIRRLDREGFVTDDPETEANYKKLARGGSVGAMASALIDLRMELVFLGAHAPRALRDDLEATLLRVGRLATEAAEGKDVLEEAHALGQGLVGRLATRRELEQITASVDLVASAHAMGGALDKAIRATEVGLAVLPDDPVLLDLLANLRSDSGDPAGALPLVDAALARADALSPQRAEKIRATKAEIEAALRAD